MGEDSDEWPKTLTLREFAVLAHPDQSKQKTILEYLAGQAAGIRPDQMKKFDRYPIINQKGYEVSLSHGVVAVPTGRHKTDVAMSGRHFRSEAGFSVERYGAWPMWFIYCDWIATSGY